MLETHSLPIFEKSRVPKSAVRVAHSAVGAGMAFFCDGANPDAPPGSVAVNVGGGTEMASMAAPPLYEADHHGSVADWVDIMVLAWPSSTLPAP